MESANDWTVKLEFYTSDNSLTFGTGFFINIPATASHEVILTAAHNLIDAKGKPTKDLIVHLPRVDPNGPPDAPAVIARYPVPDADIRISASYRKKQTDNDAEDFGAILLPRGAVRGYGFGYSLKLAYEQTLRGDVYVSGYRAMTPPGHPITSSGLCICCYDKQLEYRAETEQGISGSPVWFEFERVQTVVAIQYVANHLYIFLRVMTLSCSNRAARRGGGSRGSRITLALLREVFSWVSGVGQYAVQLRALDGPKKSQGPKLPKPGIFLHFSKDWDFGRVKLGAGSLLDVLPVQTSSGQGNSEMLALAVENEWVFFNPMKNEVKLVDRLRDGCLFKKGNIKLKKKSMRIVVKTGGREYQLKMQCSMIDEFDGDDAESSEVSLVRYPEDNDDLVRTCLSSSEKMLIVSIQFTEFTFE